MNIPAIVIGISIAIIIINYIEQTKMLKKGKLKNEETKRIDETND